MAKGELILHPNATLTPQLLLRLTASESDDLTGTVVLTMKPDEEGNPRYNARWSNMAFNDLLAMAKVLDFYIHRALSEQLDDIETDECDTGL